MMKVLIMYHRAQQRPGAAHSITLFRMGAWQVTMYHIAAATKGSARQKRRYFEIAYDPTLLCISTCIGWHYGT